MKRTKLILSFIAAVLTVMVFVQACKKENSNNLSGTYEIGLKETIKIPANGSSISATLTNVNDSRCPINANCVTAGYVFINLKITNKNSEQNFELCSENCLDKVLRPNSIVLDGITYEIKLLDVTPFPDISSTVNTNKKAAIVITKI
ncbi:MAG: hypothetical protein EOO47_03860 [Flavobacterium sp.]|nr:MAG: hypothetical protein EOO47_03860 [Flavobacterium sp.]